MVDSMEIGLTDEELPNDRSDDVETALSGISDDADRSDLVTVSGISPNVLVSTASNLFGDQETLKATRIIIHDPSTLDVLKSAQQTITFNPLNRSLSVPEKNFNWDPSVYDPILPVRCRNVRGELHKNRFGSGSKGRSVLVNGVWYTPSEFEQLCGRGNSKDWKRSIRYAGRTLMCLIEEGILRPHATSCTCGACCDDSIIAEGEATPEATTGPVRLFTPYKRRRRLNHPKLKVATSVTNVEIPNNERNIPVELTAADDICINGTPSDSVGALSVPLVTRESGSIIVPDSVIVTPAATPQTPKSAPTALDFSEQKQWWQLEEMVKNAVRLVLELQKQVENVKNESANAREAALQQLKIQMENEKKEALNVCRAEAQVAMSRALLEAKTEKEAAVDRALQQARLEMQEKLHVLVTNKTGSIKHCANCDREAFSECAICHRVSYCSAFCQRKDWQSHRDDCGDHILATEDCSELVDECDDPTS